MAIKKPIINFSLMLITISYYSLNRQQEHNEISSNSWETTYDYIVIGGGSAGCIVASRLSEDPSVKVLLLEAGGPQTVISDIPGLYDINYRSELDWHYITEPQKYSAFALESNKLVWNAGKVIGGSSTINFMLYNRGIKYDYDDWNVTDWTFRDVFPWFLVSEKNTDYKLVNQNPTYHNTRGLLTVSSPDYNDPYAKYFLKAANKAGYPTIDLNGPSKNGIMIMQRTIEDGVRESTANAYLENNNAYKRENLDILLNAFVTKILFENNSKENSFKTTDKHLPRASQVEFYYNNKYHRVKAKKEIILSAGSIRTPQLLMLSGIGPKKELEKFDIDVIVDLPAVGQNLHDHCSIEIVSFVGDPNSDDNEKLYRPQPNLTAENLYEFYVNRTGPLTVVSFISLYVSTPENLIYQWPDVNLDFQSSTIPHDLNQFIERYRLERKNEWINYFKPYKGKNFIASSAIIMRPLSRGNITLKSKNPFDQPAIDPQYLANPKDVRVLMNGLKMLYMIFNTKTLGLRYKMLYFEKPIPGCEPCSDDRRLIECDKYIICLIRSFPQVEWHYTGTSRIKSYKDNDNSKWVVDERLRVEGVKGLRVIDASIMPRVTSGNTNAPTIMIAERGAHFVRNDNNYI